MSPVRNLDKVKLWVEHIDNGVKKFAPSKGPQETGKNYFQGDMQELKNKGHMIYLETTFDDFLKALKSSKPSVSQDDLGKYINFTKEFGMDG